jgi:hypothetical protein
MLLTYLSILLTFVFILVKLLETNIWIVTILESLLFLQPSDKDSGLYKTAVKTPNGTLDAETKINIKGKA